MHDNKFPWVAERFRASSGTFIKFDFCKLPWAAGRSRRRRGSRGGVAGGIWEGDRDRDW